jgi:hypothetical protein
VAAVPRLVEGPCLLNVVWRGKTPDISLEDAQSMGYKLAILPALLFTAVIGVCDAMLEELRRTRRHPVPAAGPDASRSISPARRRGMGPSAHALSKHRSVDHAFRADNRCF